MASALGRTREEPIEDLASLELGVRIDQPGSVLRDFQTERPAKGKPLPLSNRYYLSDAKFLVALGGPLPLLQGIDNALRKPVWPLYLGRRSCPPDVPVTLGIRKDCNDVREALRAESWLASENYKKRNPEITELEIVCDGRDGELCESQGDYPVSFSLTGRRYLCRPVIRTSIPLPGTGDSGAGSSEEVSDAPREGVGSCAPRAVDDHDPMGFF